MKKISVLFTLLIAITLVFSGCKTTETPKNGIENSSIAADENGYKYSIRFEVVDAEGKTESKDIETNEEILGNALQSLELIKGEEGPYGLYIKEVCGIVADYDKDGTYWALYINGEYAMSGVDQIKITNGSTYSFRIETM